MNTEDKLYILLDSVYLFTNPLYIFNKSYGPEGLSD